MMSHAAKPGKSPGLFFILIIVLKFQFLLDCSNRELMNDPFGLMNGPEEQKKKGFYLEV